MATLILPGNSSATAQPELASGLRYVARQPILDLRGRVHGYELLFRSGPETYFRGNGDLATRAMIDNAVIFGLERLTGGLPAFINCARESLIEQYVNILPPSMTVLELVEGLEPSPSLIAACEHLKALGYRLALEGLSWLPGFAPLVSLADYIKVDFTQLASAGRQYMRENLCAGSVALIAQKVETQEDYQRAREEGFTLFQGYYFCRPMLMENRKIPANRVFQIEILELLQNETLDMAKLSHLVKRDPSLAYRVLRLVNATAGVLRQEVSSIEAAMSAVGEEAFRRIATIAITSELSDEQPTEVLRMAYVRGRFCELAAFGCSLNPTEQYLLGMMSLLPAMMGLPMDELAPSLPLRDGIREALKGADIPERGLLQWLEFYERGDWTACDAVVKKHGLNAEDLVCCYTEAVLWAEAAVQSAA
jgi:EAL and modified HD-GYP domain-containing signal transduction protein